MTNKQQNYSGEFADAQYMFGGISASYLVNKDSHELNGLQIVMEK